MELGKVSSLRQPTCDHLHDVELILFILGADKTVDNPVPLDLDQ